MPISMLIFSLAERLKSTDLRRFKDMQFIANKAITDAIRDSQNKASVARPRRTWASLCVRLYLVQQCSAWSRED